MQEMIYELKNKIKFLRHNFGRIILLSFFVLTFLIAIYFYNNNFRTGELHVTFFDVGQGDSAMIETPSHKKIVIDAGPSDGILSNVDDEMSLFDRDIDLAIMSHPDQDHIGGFVPLMQKYNFKKIIWNGDDDKKTEMWNEIRPTLILSKEEENTNTKSVIANCGDEINFNDGVIMYILHPEQNDFSTTDTNTNSIVALLTYENYSFLFTGDLDAEGERKMFFDIENCFAPSTVEMINNSLKNLTILKVSHHGSNSGSSEMFLKKVTPTYSIVSVAEKNKYNLPNPDAMSRIKKYSKYILRTDESGDIKFVISGEGFEVLRGR